MPTMPTMPPFPHPVNETAVRVTAGEVLALNTVAFGFGQMWILPLIAADFTVRAVAGPRFSPLAILASKGVIPRLKLAPKPAAGPPKRFAAAMGAVCMIGASGLHFAGARKQVRWLGVVMILFPALESFFGLCVGCKVFGVLMRLNLVPDEVCEACANLNLRKDREPDTTSPDTA